MLTTLKFGYEGEGRWGTSHIRKGTKGGVVFKDVEDLMY